MKFQNLFSWKSKKNVMNLSSAELAQRVVMVKAWDKTGCKSLLNLIFCQGRVLGYQKQ